MSVVSRTGLRLAAAVRGPRLDEQLAYGCPPGWSSLHAFRARQLAAPRLRWSLARSLRDVVTDIRRPSVFSPRVPVRRSAVADAEEPLLELASALTDPGCDSPRGVAMTQQLVCDGRSPLYMPGESLREAAERALAALRQDD